MAGYVVVLDANVLYGIDVTDLMATMATRRLFRPHWSPQILDEVARNLAKRPDLDEASIGRRIGHMNRALPDALTDVPDELIDAMPVNEKDRHVLALAVHVGAPTVVTDNLKEGKVVPPEGVVRHDPDDPYLVVAADKGTATFSDIANGIALDYGFWLGDAFASGGSAGYDHKGMGITAKGGWVSVQRHFRERGIDVQKD